MRNRERGWYIPDNHGTRAQAMICVPAPGDSRLALSSASNRNSQTAGSSAGISMPLLGINPVEKRRHHGTEQEAADFEHADPAERLASAAWLARQRDAPHRGADRARAQAEQRAQVAAVREAGQE